MIDNDKISGTQLWIFIVLTVIGVGVFSLPRQAAEAADQDGWVVIILAGLVSVLNYYVISRLAKRFPEYTMVEIMKSVAGKYIGYIMVFIVWLYIILVGAMSLRIAGEVVKMSLLLKTPAEIIIITLLLPIMWLARGGVEPITRFFEVVFPIVIIALAFIIIFALPMTDFSNILPILRSSPSKLFTGIFKVMYSFSGYEFVMLIIPFIRNPKNIFKPGLIALSIVTVVYTVLVILSLGKFGIIDVKLLIWPTLSMIRSIEVPGSFVERLEGVVMSQWILLAFTTLAPLAYGLAVIMSRAFGHKEFKHFCTFVIPPLYLISLFPNNIVEAYKYLDYITSYLGTLSMFLFPITLLIVSSIRKVGKRTNG